MGRRCPSCSVMGSLALSWRHQELCRLVAQNGLSRLPLPAATTVPRDSSTRAPSSACSRLRARETRKRAARRQWRNGPRGQCGAPGLAGIGAFERSLPRSNQLTELHPSHGAAWSASVRPKYLGSKRNQSNLAQLQCVCSNTVY